VLEDVISDFGAERLSIVRRGPEMNAGKDAGILHFLERR